MSAPPAFGVDLEQTPSGWEWTVRRDDAPIAMGFSGTFPEAVTEAEAVIVQMRAVAVI